MERRLCLLSLFLLAPVCAHRFAFYDQVIDIVLHLADSFFLCSTGECPIFNRTYHNLHSIVEPLHGSALVTGCRFFV